MADFIERGGGALGPPPPVRPLESGDIRGFEGVGLAPRDVPKELEDPPDFYEIDPHTGRIIPILSPGEPPSFLQKIRDYLGIRPPKAGPLELATLEERLVTPRPERTVDTSGFEGISAPGVIIPAGLDVRRVKPFDLRQSVFAGGVEEELRRVIGRGFAGFTGGVPDLIRGYEEHPETFPGALLGAGAELGGFLLGPFKTAKWLTGTRFAPTSTGLIRIAQILTEGAANLGIASSLSAIAPSLLESDTLTDAGLNIMQAGAYGAAIGAVFPVLGEIPNAVARVSFGLVVIDLIRSFPGQWFTIDDILVGMAEGTLDPQDLARAAFGYMMDIYFSLKVPSMRAQFAALENRLFREALTLDPTQAQDTLVQIGKRQDLDPRVTPGITIKDLKRHYGSVKEWRKVGEITEPRPGVRQAEDFGEFELRAGRELLAEQQARALADTLEQVGEGMRTGSLIPADTLSGFTQVGGFKSLVAQMFPEIADIRKPSGKQRTPGEIVKAIRVDKDNPLYLEILERMKVGISDQDVREVAQAAGDFSDEGFQSFVEGLEELAELEGVPINRITPRPPLMPPPPAPPAPPGPPTEPPPEGFAQRVERMYNRTDKELKALRKTDFKTIRRKLATATFDLSAEVKKQLLDRYGDLGQSAVIYKDLALGMGAKADAEATTAEKAIGRDLNKVQDKQLERHIQSRRTITIDEHHEAILKFERDRLILIPEEQRPEQLELIAELLQEIRHPDNLGRAEHEAYMRALKEADPETFALLEERADLYFAEFKKDLDLMLAEGLITERSHENLSRVGDYSPRRFIQHIDPSIKGLGEGGRTITVPDSGIKRLDKGSFRIMESDWRLMLRESKGRLHRRIGRNNANKALFTLATEVPENDIVTLFKGGKVPTGFTEISVMIRGQRSRMIMPNELAKQWIETDPAITSQFATFIGWASGAKILRPMATGLNPEFALTNFPRDILHVWLTTQEYSPHVAIAAKEFAADLKATAYDATHRTGAYVDYINEGGGMGFLTHQGLFRGLTGRFADAQRLLSFAGETSEIWVRLALRHRAIRNGKAPHEATWIARNYLDFAQGGWLVKGADVGIPYLNASVQATRGIFRAAKQKPGVTMFKFAQLGTLAMGLYLANRMINKEAWDSTSARDKVNNFIITMPSMFDFTDDEGNKRHIVIKIAKDQSQRVVSTVFEAMMAKILGDPVDVDQVTQAVWDFIPIMPTETMPPTATAMFGYFANKDFWRNEDIWKGPAISAREEYTNYTHPAIKEFGRLGLSPERTQFALQQLFTYGNIYTSIVGAGASKIMEFAGAETRERTTMDLIRTPFVRRIIKATDPFEPHRVQIEQIRLEDATNTFIINRDLDGLTDKLFRARRDKKPTAALAVEVRNFVRQQQPHLWAGLFKRVNFANRVFDIPNRRLWLTLHAMPPEARATAFHNVFMQTDPKGRRALIEQARRIKGIGSARFINQFKKHQTATRRFLKDK